MALRKKKTKRAKLKKPKTVARGSTIKKKKTPARANKTTAKKKLVSKKKSPSPKATNRAKKKTVKSLGKIKHKTLKSGVKVRVGKGLHIGQIGKIIRQDPYLGTFFISFDRYKKDAVYKDLEWGPYFEADIKILP